MKLNHRRPGGHFAASRVLLSAALLLIIGAIVLTLGSPYRISQSTSASQLQVPMFWGQSSAAAEAVPAGQPRNFRVFLGQHPLSFEPNQGLTNSQVRFLTRGNGYALFLTADEAVLKLQHSAVSTQHSAASVVRMRLVGANQASEISGADQLPGKSNYIIGNDPAKWHSNVPHFARVRYREIYPGVDLVYYGKQGQLEYDFEVAPGADTSTAQLSFEGSDRLLLDANGDLLIEAGGGDVRLHAPQAYQQIGAEKRAVPGKFVVAGNRVSFEVGSYDRSRTLVIDPVLTYSSYLGGSGDETCASISIPGQQDSLNCPTIAVDAAFNIYVAGRTTSSDFPPQPGVIGSLNGPSDVFVTKFDPTGASIVFSTYLGGSSDDSAAGVRVDGLSNVYVAGTTSSADFPQVNGITNPTLSASPHAFVSVVTFDGSGLVYSTLIGGDGTDVISGLTTDNKRNAYVIGTTTSSNLAVTPNAYQASALATTQFFIAKINTTSLGSASLAFLSYFGGGNPIAGQAVGGGIAVDTNNNVFITGGTNFLNTGTSPHDQGGTDFPILDAPQPCLDNPTGTNCAGSAPTALDAFVAKINLAPTVAQLVYSTYLGGTGDDIGYGIAVDSGGQVYMTGSTSSSDWNKPTATPHQAAYGGGAHDAFVIKLNNPSTGAVVTPTYFTYLGGSGDDQGNAIAVDTSGRAQLTGSTDSSANFTYPTSGTLPIQTTLGGGKDAFFARIDTAGVTTNDYVTYLGGSGDDHGTSIFLDANLMPYLAGDTASPNFPLSSAPNGLPYQSSLDGPSDVFLTKLGSQSDLALTVTPLPNPVTSVSVGVATTFKYTITNNGPDPTSAASFVDYLPTTGATFTTSPATASPGACGSSTGTPPTVTCTLGAIANAGTASVTVTLTPTVGGALLSNSGNVSVSGLQSVDPNLGNNTASTSVAVTDYAVSVPPPSTQTVVAGNSATYQIVVSPLPSFTNSVSLSVTGLPTNSTSSFSTNPLAFSSTNSTSPLSSTLTISTKARPVSSTALHPSSGMWYALFLPVPGLALLGWGLGKGPRRKRWVVGALLGLALSVAALQSACGGSSGTTPPTGGTPAGTYTLTITGTSGSASHGVTVQLIVQ